MNKFFLSIFVIAVALLPLACSDTSNERASETGQPAVDQPNDATLTTQIKARYTDDELVRARAINVDAQNGVVTLTGSVGSHMEAERAAEIARNVEGVQRVESNLQIDTTLAQSGGEMEEHDPFGEGVEGLAEEARERAGDLGDTLADAASDATITTTVKLKLADDDLVKARNIDVDTRNQVVTLKGTVASQKEVERAIQIARSVENVRSVESDLIVRSSTGA